MATVTAIGDAPSRRAKLTTLPPPSERDIQRGVLHYLAARRITAIHYPAGGTDARWRAMMARAGSPAGVPDILLLRPATMTLSDATPTPGLAAAFMEVKRPGGRLSPAQTGWRDWCRAVGAPWALVTSIDDAQAALTDWGWLTAAAPSA